MPGGYGKSHASLKVWFWRALRFFHTRVREVRSIAKALVSTKHPFLVHIIPTRRCNLACTYCNEFDDFSPPRSEEHTSELQSHSELVCRLLLEKKKQQIFLRDLRPEAWKGTEDLQATPHKHKKRYGINPVAKSNYKGVLVNCRNHFAGLNVLDR